MAQRLFFVTVKTGSGCGAVALLLTLVMLSGCSGDDSAHVLQAANVAVLVGAPADGGDDAAVTGTVTIIDGCLGIDNDVAVWPAGTKIVEAEGPVIDVPDLGSVRVGDRVEGAGGYLSARDLTGEQSPPLPTTCGDASIVVYRPE